MRVGWGGVGGRGTTISWTSGVLLEFIFHIFKLIKLKSSICIFELYFALIQFRALSFDPFTESQTEKPFMILVSPAPRVRL